MATLNELKKYKYYEFSSGPYTGDDYKQFQTKYINYLRSVCRLNGWELVNVGRNHYCFSAFIKDGYKCVYLSISDVRGRNNEWLNRILIRCAKHEKDYHGASNNYCSLDILTGEVSKLLEWWDYEGFND